MSLCALLLALVAPALALDWEPLYEVDGVIGARAEVPDSRFHAFRGETVYDAPLERVLAVVMDNERRTEWVDRLARCDVLEQRGEHAFVLYQVFDLPPPFADRDYVYQAEVSHLPEGRVVLQASSVEHPDAPETVGVRAQVVDSRYVLTPVDGGSRTHVAVEIVTDPGGQMPAWLVNLIQRSWPVETLSGIRAQLDTSAAGRRSSARQG